MRPEIQSDGEGFEQVNKEAGYQKTNGGVVDAYVGMVYFDLSDCCYDGSREYSGF